MTTDKLSTLKIHKLSQEQYERELQADRIDESAIYLTPDEEVVSIAHGGTGATTASDALNNLGITATATELNKMDGVTASTAELNYVKGVTSAIQTQINGKAASSHNHAASNITSGTLSVARGGTGKSSVTANSFLVGNGTGAMVEKTVAQVKTLLGATQIATGVVTGDSHASESNPNKITFPFKPKLVIVTSSERDVSSNSSMRSGWFFWIDGVTKDSLGQRAGYVNGIKAYRHYSLNENTLSWWVDQGDSISTTYASAVVGPYIAFG